MGEKMIIIVLGDFGVGKDTIVDMLVDIIGEDKAYKIRSWTTRGPRFPEEDTHNFFWWPGSTRNDRNQAFLYDVLNSGNCAAWSMIGYHYYWVEFNQIGNTEYEFYITDPKGARDIMEKIDEKFLVLEIRRPDPLINVPKERLNRIRHIFLNSIKSPHSDIVFENIYPDLKTLKDKLFDLADCIQEFE